MQRINFFIFFIFFIFVIHFSAFSRESELGYMFRLTLKDKGNPPYSVVKPEEFLSQKAIDRRLKQGLRVDTTDLPIDPEYLSAIQKEGAKIKAISKWLNTVVVYLPDSIMIDSVKALPFVNSVNWVWIGEPLSEKDNNQKFSGDRMEPVSSAPVDAFYYGAAYDQIHMNNGDFLHAVGFKGEGMTVAVIDASFTGVSRMDFFNPDQILGYRNFTHYIELSSSEDEEHGTKVLSCMLANKPGEMVGTAPDASYYLIQTEVPGEEYAVEEDYWVAGIEYADSLGVDVVNSSLGYTMYDTPSMGNALTDLDGKTAQISKAASIASKKGMLVFVSAGNEGNKEWGAISFPGDAEGVVTVGSVDSQKEIAYFSSVGYTADKRVKPDLVAKGMNVSVVYPSGNVYSYANGTSFSSPILAGLGACLWQALPDYTSEQIIDLLRENSDHYQSPDSQYGYGIPNVYQAYLSVILKKIIKF